ncbi:unknown [Prevotella sp. CAG:891]|nr:unknown [Prevotella sp. CAG:891]
MNKLHLSVNTATLLHQLTSSMTHNTLSAFRISIPFHILFSCKKTIIGYSQNP